MIAGGADGIGLVVGLRLAERGLAVCVADHNEEALEAAAARLAEVAPTGRDAVLAVATDVARLDDLVHLRERVFERFGDVALLMNNAGIGGGGGPWQNYEGWQRVLAVNLGGVINGVHAFAEAMIAQDKPAAIVNTGSKQGITNPPGDAAYNVSKAGVKSLSESLAHALRSVEGCRVTAHLLIPGFTYTGMVRRHLPEKPPSAWLPEQVADELLRRMGEGAFYVLCPDNDVSAELDFLRMQWNLDDIVKARPALSRWHDDYKAAFDAFVSAGLKGGG